MKETSIIPCCSPKIRLLPGLRPGPRWRSLRSFPRPLSWLVRATLPRPLPLGAFGASTFKKRLRRLYYKSQGSALSLFYPRTATDYLIKWLNLGLSQIVFVQVFKRLTVKNFSNSLHDVNNYRPVSIISILAKTFESLVDLHYGHLFHFHDNRLGFCDEGGCNKAIFAFTNPVRYFRNRHSNIYLAALEVTKTFDTKG